MIAWLPRRSGRDIGSTIRRFFQQGILLTLVILVATGVTGLLSVADPDVAAGPGYLAFMLSCVIVGGLALMLAAYPIHRRNPPPRTATIVADTRSRATRHRSKSLALSPSGSRQQAAHRQAAAQPAG